MCKQVPLGQAHHALVDDADYPSLAQRRWFRSENGYAIGFIPTGERFKLEYMHRLLMNAPPHLWVDHINGDPLDNRRSNLRLATPAQNIQYKRISPLSQTGLKGVGWHKRRKKFHARIQQCGSRVHLGFFEDAETAALAYDFAARTLFGAFARPNYPDQKTPRSVADSVRERLIAHRLLRPQNGSGATPAPITSHLTSRKESPND